MYLGCQSDKLKIKTQCVTHFQVHSCLCLRCKCCNLLFSLIYDSCTFLHYINPINLILYARLDYYYGIILAITNCLMFKCFHTQHTPLCFE